MCFDKLSTQRVTLCLTYHLLQYPAYISDNKRQDLNSAVVFCFGVVINAMQTHTQLLLIVYYFILERVQKWFCDCNLLTDKLRRCDMV